MTRARDRGPANRCDRALSNTIGFIFIFSFLIIGFTIYQGVVVPQQNKQVEFDHNQEVQTQMQDLRNAIQNSAGGTDQSASVTLGADYPQRTISENLAISTGRIRLVDPGSGILIRNVTPVDGETKDYFNASSPTIGPLETKSVSYEPQYTRYATAPTTVIENTVAYNRFDNGANLTLTDQAIIDGRRITLIAINGSYSKVRDDTVSIDAEALSAASDPIAVTNASGTSVNLTIPTRLSAANWSDLLESEMDTAGTDERYVKKVKDTGKNQVTIILEQGVSYDLRLAKVGIGADIADEGAHYVIGVSGNASSIAEGGTQKLIVEVRDRFNNPVSNVTVQSTITQSAGSGDLVTPSSAVTDREGQASFVYEAPGGVDGTQSSEVAVYFETQQPERQRAVFHIDVLDADGSGGPGGCNSAGTGSNVTWCSGANTTVSQPGGIISGIGSASHINISDPSFTSIRPDNGQVTVNEERFRLAFVIEKNVADTSGTTRYMFVIPSTNAGFNQDLNNAGTTVQNRGVEIYEDALTNTDGAGWTSYVSSQVLQTDLDNWYDGNEVIDLLDADHYAGGIQASLDLIKNFMQNNDVRIYIVDMDGRVDIEIS